jgi:hypothetical protein
MALTDQLFLTRLLGSPFAGLLLLLAFLCGVGGVLSARRMAAFMRR